MTEFPTAGEEEIAMAIGYIAAGYKEGGLTEEEAFEHITSDIGFSELMISEDQLRSIIQGAYSL